MANANVKDWRKNKLTEDIYDTLRIKEQSQDMYLGHSPHMWMRPALVNWILMLTQWLDESETTRHLAVYMLDYFLDEQDVDFNRLFLVAETCVMMAVKFEDNSRESPKFSTEINLVPHLAGFIAGFIPPGLGNSPAHPSYTLQDYLSMEQAILHCFDCDLAVSVVPHFVPYFLQKAVDDKDLLNGCPIKSKQLVESLVEMQTLHFQTVCLQDPSFYQIAPSLVAASCVASSRMNLELTPTWPKRLELITDYSLEELMPCTQKLLKSVKESCQQPCQVISSHIQRFHDSPRIQRFHDSPRIQRFHDVNIPNDENHAAGYSTSLRNYDRSSLFSAAPNIPWSQRS
ncbi:hypothetical protein ACJMK2_005705 [Sinanodonta woodiana]|uniref:Uncharacterized protein n=1 Tax=Sinanodonta woodiana TaxID=1069815 RepID=A0ABD3VQX0_SINWO